MKLDVLKRYCLVGAVVSFTAFSGCETMDDVGRAFSGNHYNTNSETTVSGLKEALSTGTEIAVAQVSKEGGYWNNPSLKIPLPKALQKFAETLRGIGLGDQVDLLEKKMNEGAEMAAASASPVFMTAIKNMAIPDARGILTGSDTAATDFLRAKTYMQLKSQYSPVIGKELEKACAVKLYNELYQKYSALPLVPKLDVKLEDYVTEKALDGLFSVVAGEEKKIRQDPAARTTELLKKVFGK
ncbi:MAG: DUF4197 domain-containing protein [Victivallales bacterium]|jgi:hypothetical protein